MVFNKINRKFICVYAILIVAGSVFNSLAAQVTMGIGESPSEGALLQLKNIPNITSGDANSTKGMGLPRVELTDKNNLFPMFDGDDDYKNNLGGKKNQEDKKHAGMVVYNTMANICARLTEGVCVWDGSSWTSLGYSDLELGMYAPNCYMIESDGTASGATTVSIPVEKAYTIWQYYGRSEIDRLPANVDLSGGLVANIYWQENTAPVGQPTISGSGRGATISVPVTGNYGNAVISLSIGGIIRWSWHIWVTPPMNTNSFNDVVWMDRNLGATSTGVLDINRYGLYYQHGRKDPFFRSTLRNSDIEPVLSSTGLISGIANQQVNDDSRVNFSASITSPNTFIWAVDGDGSFDWYSTSATNEKYLWADRWNSDECGNSVKTAFDPCPKGWHVPSSTSPAVSPWNGLTKTAWNEAPSGWGIYWTNPDAGYYPGNGVRGGSQNSKGKIEYNGTHVYMWSASSDFTTNRVEAISMVANFPSSYLETNIGSGRSNGYAVRCVKFEE